MIAEVTQELVRTGRGLGALSNRWVLHDLRDEVVDFVRTWSQRTGIMQKLFVLWIGIQPSKYHDWRLRYGKVNAHNACAQRVGLAGRRRRLP